jgi:2-methylisocitrate lyase-like PEP mutase family enzyme
MSRHQTFYDLHQSGCFVMPNPWDVGSARLMAGLGAKALATSSAAHAFTLGRLDGGTLTRDEALAHAELIVSATNLPVNGDLENGFADDPDQVAETVRLAAEVGLSGCSIEDTIPTATMPAYDFALAVERIKAATSAARALNRPFILCARADGVLQGSYDLAEAIRRLQAFEAAGADLLYCPFPPGTAELKHIIASVGKPVNALAAGALRQASVADLAALGVRRISLGSQVARMAQTAIVTAVRAMLDQGSFAPLLSGLPGNDIDALLHKGSPT